MKMRAGFRGIWTCTPRIQGVGPRTPCAVVNGRRARCATGCAQQPDLIYINSYHMNKLPAEHIHTDSKWSL